MIEWLLKEDEKAKVGRPKLADDKLLRRSRILLVSSVTVVLVLAFFFGCYFKDIKPTTALYKMTIGKILGPLDNTDGFMIKEYYDDNSNYVMKFRVSNTVKNYSASYKYTTYYMKNNKWIKKESKTLDNDTTNFKIVFESKKNTNVLWKVKLQLVNANKIIDTYTPYDWYFMKSKKAEYNYAYKVFTVRGYYSPVTIEEIKEAGKNKDKITVYTEKENPRVFNVSAPDLVYDINVSYTDSSGIKTTVKSKKNVIGISKYTIPDTEKLVNVKFKIWIKESNRDSLEKLKLSNWVVKEDKDNNSYIENTYLLKPSKAY